MNWYRLVGLLCLSIGASGCATSAHRESLSAAVPRTSGKIKVVSPRQVQQSVTTDEADLFAPVPAKPDKYHLAHYFPGLSRSLASKSPVTDPNVIVSKAEIVPAGQAAAAATKRPSWFGLRKSRVSQTYLTDARSTASKIRSDTAILPVALQIPTDRVADRAVKTTSVDIPDTAPSDAPAETKETTAVPANPSASDSDATPLSTTEPQLNVDPIAPPSALTKVKISTGSEADSIPDSIDDKPAPEIPTEAPDVDPRERPRLPSSLGATAIDATPETVQAEPAAKPSLTEVVATIPAEVDRRAIRAVPSAADPANSLGLPEATVPASYTKHESMAVRGSHQGSQPPPVLASPQVAPTPQSSVKPTAAKTWRRPCLRRLIRRMCKMGEFANPPTAKPH